MAEKDVISIVGIDCAVDAKRVGYAVARIDGTCVVEHVGTLQDLSSGLPKLVADLGEQSRHTLLALDAPLGWPAPMAEALSGHRAGEQIAVSAHDVFRRATDKEVRDRLRKQTLDVGADRIARTAHAALKMLAAVRSEVGEVPLAWSPKLATRFSAIEVYPAGTLVAREIDPRGYKDAKSRGRRKEILELLETDLTIAADRDAVEANADVLDAVVCVLAAKEFLDGLAPGPSGTAQAAREGWIWVASKRQVRLGSRE